MTLWAHCQSLLEKMGIVKTVLIDIVLGGFMGTKWALGKICRGAFIRVSGKRIEHVTSY